MAKGRKPTPSHLKVVRGTTRADRANPSEPKPARMIPDAPEHMTDRAREIWPYVAGVADKMGILTEADGLALQLMCEAYSNIRSAQDEIVSAGGETYVTEGGLIKAHPAVAMRNDASRRLQSLLAEFGMSPSSRSKVSPKDKDDEENEAAKYFG